jgi:hypothetical protein
MFIILSFLWEGILAQMAAEGFIVQTKAEVATTFFETFLSKNIFLKWSNRKVSIDICSPYLDLISWSFGANFDKVYLQL